MFEVKVENTSKEYDVIVVGGGVSGAIAAIAAARYGGDVLLIEQNGFLGGTLTASGVGPMMTFHAGNVQVIQGITDELIERLKRQGKSTGHILDTTGYTYTVTPFDAEAMKHELELMLIESGGQVLYHTMLASVDCKDGSIGQIIVCNKAGLSALKAKCYVDASGDADLSVWAGVEYAKGREADGLCQPMTMNLKMYNVDMDAVKSYIREHPEEFPKLGGDIGNIDRSSRLSISEFLKVFADALLEGEITFQRGNFLFFETNNPGEVIINTSRIHGKDGTDPMSLSEAETEGRQQIRQLEKALNTRVPGFSKAVTAYSGPSVGVRGTRQIKGLYTLGHQDVLSCRAFTDVIAHSGYPIDIHSPDGKHAEENHLRLKWGDMYIRSILRSNTKELTARRHGVCNSIL
ncbi:FAD-dependent oxidoreductase [Paenibacillus periandrae]|uniref:FAD-dependent oxidoreductase n=1 Tax=Paenibacillus periandrae TaxID=1761741 RepID=UPI001F0905E6|nr:FAD-dependent oxidoreductase [Paenibacillus periandrae]